MVQPVLNGILCCSLREVDEYVRRVIPTAANTSKQSLIEWFRESCIVEDEFFDPRRVHNDRWDPEAE